MIDASDLSRIVAVSVAVSELSLHIKRVLDSHDELQAIWVRGEITDLHRHTQSGHLYFSLKDSESRLKCVMFKSDCASVEFEPQDGMSVAALGDVSVYTRGGVYQLYARRLVNLGDGMLFRSFEMVKKKLAEEGLFDLARKRGLPEFPRRIAVITSPEGAAIKDVIAVIGRRYPAAELVVVPCAVQGTEAPASIARALELAAEDGEFDVGILTRGGGAADDLWAFNDELVARQLAAMPFPMICAVGHERDFTICDLVADLRAPTPSAAAEMAVPDRAVVLERVASLSSRARRSLAKSLDLCSLSVDRLLGSWVFRRPEMIIDTRRQALEEALHRLETAFGQILAPRRARLDLLMSRADSSSPLKTLQRGYSIVTSLKSGNLVTSKSQVHPGDEIEIRVSDGLIHATVSLTGGDSESGD
ncbi:MAG: exodeoxyribonuclease VII large subunit [Firmicutes bacterium]|nr:exodeoxyribonuclease VII large subunit [Bacillota bacterium]